MTARKNIPRRAVVELHKRGRYPAQEHLPQSGHMQSNIAAASQLKRGPVPPPVYRPQPVPKVLQTKQANGSPHPAQSQIIRTRHVAPHVIHTQRPHSVSRPRVSTVQAQPTHTSQAIVTPPRPVIQRTVVPKAVGITQQPTMRQTPHSIVTPTRHGSQSASAQRKTPATPRSEPQVEPKRGNRSNAQHAQVIQPYFTISRGSVYRTAPSMIGNVYNLVGTIAYAPNSTSFPAQQKDPNTESFLNPQKQMRANIQLESQPGLRISDDYQMAIEETNLGQRQAKCFFAVPRVVTRANSELQRVDSAFELISTTETITIFSPWQRQRYVLNKVVPRIRGQNLPNPLKMVAQQNCNDFATQFTGANSETQLKPIYATSDDSLLPSLAMQTDLKFIIAQLVAKRMGTEKHTAPRFSRASIIPESEYKRLRWSEEGYAEMNRMEAKAINEIAQKYVSALRARGSQSVARQLGINESASPEVGDSFVTTTVYEQDRTSKQIKDLRTGKSFVPSWGYHFGGVVAKSGNDAVTLENYARNDEDNKVMGNKPLNAQDPRWYFQMYGFKQAAQSFHQAQANSGGFANPLTLALRNPNRKEATQTALLPYQPHPPLQLMTARQAVVGSAVLMAIVGTVLRKYDLI